MSEKYAPSWLEEIYLQKHMSENAVSNLGILHSDFVFSNVSSVELTQKSRTPPYEEYEINWSAVTQ